MSHFVLIMGETGSGKSTSLKTLNPKETYLINVLNKDLPFKGSSKMYNPENKNYYETHNLEEVIGYLANISEKAPHIKNVVIDDAIYLMRIAFFDRVNEKGYDKYNFFADGFRRLVQQCSAMRKDMNIFMLLHSESESDSEDAGMTRYKASTVGKLTDKMFRPEESVSICLFCQPQYDKKDGKPKFGFYTHPIMVNKVKLPSKSPDGMFEEDFIPNDLDLVIKKIAEYYG